jgi:hypothetical protein
MAIQTLKTNGTIHLPEKLYTAIMTLPHKDDIDKSFLAFISLLIQKKQIKRKFNATRWVNLSSLILKGYEFIGNKIHYSCKKHLDYLKNSGIIERTTSYSTSNNIAKGHRINESLINIDDRLVPVTLISGLAAKINNRRETRKRNARRTTLHLTKWLDGDGFTFASSSAMSYTNNEFAGYKDKRAARAREILEFDNMKYSREGKDGRLHTNFTRMPSDLRRFVSYKGEKMHTVDLPNSQPLMLSVLIDKLLVELDREMDCNKPSIESLTRRIGKILKQYCAIADNKTNHDRKVYATANNVITNIKEISYALSSTMFPNQLNISDYEYINHFKTLTRSKELYQYVGEKLFEQGIIKRKKGYYEVLLTDEDLKTPALKPFASIRECGKEITFYALYSSVKNRNKAVKALKDLFPAIFKMVDTIKNVGEGNHEVFSWLLLNMESKFILDYSTKRIAKKYPAMPLITIHDSIATTESNIVLLKEGFENNFQDYFGITIKLEPELW